MPVRAVSEAVGKPISWDGKTSSVYIGKHDATEPAVWLWDLNYFTGDDYFTTGSLTDNLGNEQTNCLTPSTNLMGSVGGSRTVIPSSNVYKINGQYSKITGTLFQIFEYRSETWESTLDIYGDGKHLYKASVMGGVEPIDFSVDLTGILELKIEYKPLFIGSKQRGQFVSAIADCGLWQ